MKRLKRALIAMALSLVVAGGSLAAAVLIYFVIAVGQALWSGLPRNRSAWENVRIVVWFGVDFLRDLLMSNLVLLRDILSPTPIHRIAIVHVPVADLREGEAVLLVHRITLTPGTLSCDFTADRRHLIVHAMYAFDDDSALALRKPIDVLFGRDGRSVR